MSVKQRAGLAGPCTSVNEQGGDRGVGDPVPGGLVVQHPGARLVGGAAGCPGHVGSGRHTGSPVASGSIVATSSASTGSCRLRSQPARTSAWPSPSGLQYGHCTQAKSAFSGAFGGNNPEEMER